MGCNILVLGATGGADQCRVQGWGRHGVLMRRWEGQLGLVVVLVQHCVSIPMSLLGDVSSMRVQLVLGPCALVVDIIIVVVVSRRRVMINLATVIHDLGQVLVKACTATSHRASGRIGNVLLEDGRARSVPLVG